MKGFRILLVITVLLLSGLYAVHTSASSNYHIFIDEQQASFQEPLFVENGRLYVPVRFVAEQLGAAVEWNEKERSIVINSPINDNLVFYVGSKKVTLNGKAYLMDVAPLNRYERVYLPIRHISEFLHLKVNWDQNKAYLSKVPLYEVKADESLEVISAKFDTTVELMKKRNNLQSTTLIAGTKLKSVIPKVMNNQEDVVLLARIIEAESANEPFLGQVAIGNVILNRVEDERFPNSVTEVINQGGQFTPVATGIVNSITPSSIAKLAAEKALQGEKPVGKAIYFFNPEKTNNPFLLSREVIRDIGSHRFTK